MTKNNDSLKFQIRPGYEGDFFFITNSWNQSFKKGNAECRKFIPNGLYSPWIKQKQKETLQMGAVALIACSLEDPDHIFGYMIYQPGKPTIVHYMYVKQVYRQQGIASSLLNKVGLSKDKAILCTHTTEKLGDLSNYQFVKIPDIELYIPKGV